MKKLFLILAALALALSGCSRQAATTTAVPAHNVVTISFTFNRTKTIASNQFAVWIEDAGGKLVKTLFVTNFTASGGWKARPDAIPGWTGKSGISSGAKADTHSGATPKSGPLTYIWDGTDENGKAVPAGDYKFFVEGTIFWKDDVTYSGAVRLGGAAATVSADPSYTTDAAKISDMITDVRAVYTP